MELILGPRDASKEPIPQKQLEYWTQLNPDAVKAFSVLIGDDYSTEYRTTIDGYSVGLLKNKDLGLLFIGEDAEEVITVVISPEKL